MNYKLKLNLILSLLLFKFINCISKKDFIYYSIKTDDRDCPYPQCGGYWLRRINTQQSPIYVASISLDPSIINYNISLITLALTDDLLLGGLVLSYPKFKYFQVHNATRLIYNNGAEKLYAPQKNNREYQYITISQTNSNVASILDSKINNNSTFIPYIAESINLSFQFKLLSFTEKYSKTINSIDVNWLYYQITNSKTISYGFMDHSKSSFLITKIYIEIPLIGSNSDIEKCNSKKSKINNYLNKLDNEFENLNINYINKSLCSSNSIETFQRDYTKCVLFTGCINKTIDFENCDDQNIKCPHGYTLFELRTKPFGCKLHYCDVSFLI